MKKLVSLLLVIALVLSVAYASGGKEAAADGDKPLVLRVSIPETPTDNKSVAMFEVKENVERRTEGRVILEIYCNGELGTFQESIETITQGGNIIDGTSPSAYVSVVPFPVTSTVTSLRTPTPGMLS